MIVRLPKRVNLRYLGPSWIGWLTHGADRRCREGHESKNERGENRNDPTPNVHDELPLHYAVI